MVYFYTIDDHNDRFAIGYNSNPSLRINKVFREQVENFLGATFH